MEDDKVKEEVKKAVDGDGTEPSTVEKPIVQPEGNEGGNKVEPTKPVEKTEPKVADTSKLEEQVSNLNVALKEEREGRKTLETDLKDSRETINKLKDVFTPEEPTEEKPLGMTKEEFETIWEEKQQDVEKKTQEEKQAGLMKDQIVGLEEKWNGSDGKPKYEDQEVLQWQKDNNKLHLSPNEAFNEMKQPDIIDWEVKQRMAGKKPVENVERPSGGTEPAQPTEATPETDQEVRNAVIEAVNNADTEV